MTRLTITLLLAVLLSACNDSGVVVGDGSTGGNAQNPGNQGTTTGTGTTGGEEVVTGTGDPVTTTAASNLNPADVDAARFLNQAVYIDSANKCR